MGSHGKFTKAVEEAKRYSDTHDLERVITQMVNWVVHEKPDKPEAYMVRWLLEKCTPEQLQQVQKENSNLRIVAPLPEKPKVVQDRSREAWDRYQAVQQGKFSVTVEPPGSGAGSRLQTPQESARGGSKSSKRSPSRTASKNLGPPGKTLNPPSVSGSRAPSKDVSVAASSSNNNNNDNNNNNSNTGGSKSLGLPPVGQKAPSQVSVSARSNSSGAL
eukprot:CAMPEP_0206576012 /NCGR_PEP_ID=MMETSP0325_2-20121206/30475_1 /ASSEMBLY_ACC=CAM_ASM_000347 /TAXON_ID=2866 /ORGANISM="Crypthecodinium cohnii, Strain Seligo" /LENGTH=216 /DNA_ID=CAMNT_0054081101 /DNA_START=90 /DNA_END=740 /DNA_ORIENTATION=+